MMKKVLTACVLLLALACSKTGEGEPEPQIVICPVGIDSVVYQGSFERIRSGSQPGGTSQVSLQFTAGQFKGGSDQSHYPAIGQGQYQYTGQNQVNFQNLSVWTANFDWTLILNGSYETDTKNDSLYLRKTVGGVTDLYSLKRVR